MTDNRKPGTVPVYREDILELTRRMNLERSNFTRIAGCYVDADGDFDGSFNTSFLKLPARDKSKHLEIAKAVLLSKTNDEYLRYSFATGKRPGDGSFADVLFSPESGQRELQQLLYGLTDCGLKNDALLDVLYDLIMEKYRPGEPYAVIVLYGIYPSAMRSISTKIIAESTSMLLKNEPMMSIKTDKTPNMPSVHLTNLFSKNSFIVNFY